MPRRKIYTGLVDPRLTLKCERVVKADGVIHWAGTNGEHDLIEDGFLAEAKISWQGDQIKLSLSTSAPMLLFRRKSGRWNFPHNLKYKKYDPILGKKVITILVNSAKIDIIDKNTTGTIYETFMTFEFWRDPYFWYFHQQKLFNISALSFRSLASRVAKTIFLQINPLDCCATVYNSYLR